MRMTLPSPVARLGAGRDASKATSYKDTPAPTPAADADDDDDKTRQICDYAVNAGVALLRNVVNI